MSILLRANHSLNHATQLMVQGLNDQMNLFRVLNYGKNLLGKRMLQNVQKMRSPKCFFHGRAINGYSLQFCYLKRFANFYQSMAFPIFSPKDVPKMMQKNALVAPTARNFGYNDNTIKLQCSVRPISRNIREATLKINEVFTEPLPKKTR